MLRRSYKILLGFFLTFFLEIINISLAKFVFNANAFLMKNEFTIFYTDDDQEDLDFFREIIELIDNDLTVVTQRNGQQLLQALNNPPPTPHIVFLDINLPGMNGYEILKKVRAIGTHRDLPVVMLSTSSDKEAIEQSKALGASYYVTKSGAFESLKRSIEHALKINWRTFSPNEENFVYNLR